MKQIIIALSGRKCAGKNEIAKYIQSYFLHLDMSVYQCSFADTLKDFCIETLGILPEQCYGTDEQKNSPTPYLWENVGDVFLRWKFAGRKWDHKYTQFINYSPWDQTPPPSTREQFYKYINGIRLPIVKTGPMTGREIMQLFGTDLIRETFGNVWAQATIRRIVNKQCDVSLITDNRFPNEVETVLEQPCGFMIRLTRAPYKGDEHPSEASLDGYNWQRDRCFVLDNSRMSVEEQNAAVVPTLEKIRGVCDGIH